jgi:hypothetical protein
MSVDSDPANPNPPAVVNDEWLAAGLLAGLQRLGERARDRAATGGNGLLRVELVMSDNGRPVELGWARGFIAFDNSKSPTATPGQPLVMNVPVDLDAIATRHSGQSVHHLTSGCSRPHGASANRQCSAAAEMAVTAPEARSSPLTSWTGASNTPRPGSTPTAATTTACRLAVGGSGGAAPGGPPPTADRMVASAPSQTTLDRPS